MAFCERPISSASVPRYLTKLIDYSNNRTSSLSPRRRIFGIERRQLLRCERERERDGVLLHVRRRPGLRYRDDHAAADRPGERDRGGRAAVRRADAGER